MTEVAVIVPGWSSPKAAEWAVSPLPFELRKAGFEVIKFHNKRQGFDDIDFNAKRLAYMLLDLNLRDSVKWVHVIGHSMGGLVARRANQMRVGMVDSTTCIATPHLGTPTALLAPWSESARQMRPGSDWLNELDDYSHKVLGKDVDAVRVNIRARLDAIVPMKYSKWQLADTELVVNHSHMSVLLSQSLANQIVDLLSGLRKPHLN